MFIAISVTANVKAQQHLIPVTACSTVNTERTQTTQPTNHKVNKKRKFTKTSITRHSKIKKICLYTGLALGFILGVLLLELTWPIIVATFLFIPKK